MGLVCCPETSERIYHSALRKIPKESRYELRIFNVLYVGKGDELCDQLSTDMYGASKILLWKSVHQTVPRFLMCCVQIVNGALPTLPLLHAGHWPFKFFFFWVTISTSNNPGKRSLYSDWLRAGRSGVRITVCCTDILFYKTDQINSGAYKASCSMDTGVFQRG